MTPLSSSETSASDVYVRYDSPRELLRVARYEWRARHAWGSRRAGLRGLWWWLVRRYAGELCEDCGRPVGRWIGNTFWRAPDELWERVVGSPDGTVCPRHFTERADAAGVALHWRAVEGYETDQLPPDLLRVLQDPTIVIQRDREITLPDGRTLADHLHEWANAPSNTASAD